MYSVQVHKDTSCYFLTDGEVSISLCPWLFDSMDIATCTQLRHSALSLSICVAVRFSIPSLTLLLFVRRFTFFMSICDGQVTFLDSTGRMSGGKRKRGQKSQSESEALQSIQVNLNSTRSTLSTARTVAM